MFVAAGAEFDSELQSNFRTALAFSFWIANVDMGKLNDFPEIAAQIIPVTALSSRKPAAIPVTSKAS